MRRAAIFAVLALALAACSGSDGAAASGDLVAVDYVGTLTDGTEFDTSEGGDPLTFTIDDGSLIPGFNDAVVGMEVGETKTVTIPVDEAYGDYQDDLVIEVPIAQVPEGVTAGDQLQSPTGQVVTVVEVGEDFVTLDTNHPLAGEDLIFEITLVSRVPAGESGG